MTRTSGELPQTSDGLRMGEPGELAGRWIIAARGATCAVTFTTRRVEEANGWAIDTPPPCLVALVPGAVAWRPVPEGIALAAADRRTLAVFTVTDDGRSATGTIGGNPATLRRG